MGLFLDNQTLIKNEQVVYDSILSLSDGFVTKYDVKAAPHKRLSDGLFETSITAVVQKGKIGDELRRRKLVQGVDSKDAWAEAVTTIQIRAGRARGDEPTDHQSMVSSLLTTHALSGPIPARPARCVPR